MTFETQSIGNDSAPSINIEDPADLLPYLQSHRLIGPSDVPGISLLAGGVSSRTVLVQPATQPPFVLKQALEKLRVASDWFSSPRRIHTEAEGMRCLQAIAPAGTITTFLFEDFSQHVIAMSAVPSPHSTWKEVLLSQPPVPQHFDMFAKILGQIHTRSSGNQSLAQIFNDRTDFETLRLEPYYRYSAQRVPAASAFLERLIEETLSHRLALVHGDYSPKNILVHGSQFVLVDHEVIHYGDPAFDVGFSLTHLLAKAIHREPYRRQMLECAGLYARNYLACIRQAGFDDAFEARACRHTLGCLLARIEGRSPFEYLSDEERQLQRDVALRLMSDAPSALADLISSFAEALD